MENKNLRTILAVVWGMVFCFNLMLCLTNSNSSFFTWGIVGFILGGLCVIILDNVLLGIQGNYITFLNNCYKIKSRHIKLLEDEVTKLEKLLKQKVVSSQRVKRKNSKG